MSHVGDQPTRPRAAALTLRVRVGCEFVFESGAPSPSVIQVQPHPDSAHELVDEGWASEPSIPMREYADGFRNRCQRVVLPAGRARLRYSAEVEVGDDPDAVAPGARQVPSDELPNEALEYLLPSRYCLPDRLGGVAIDNFSRFEPGWSQVEAISHWVHEHIVYTLGSTDSLSDAADVYVQRQGVCRDYAHLAISFCRALNYPARYACGYIPLMGRPLPEEGVDFAAWMEVYLGQAWYTFDPRNDVRLAGRVLIGRGRDAVDVAMVTSEGAPRLDSMTVWADA
jgi:transglutaminase-like putative cysteine protease